MFKIRERFDSVDIAALDGQQGEDAPDAFRMPAREAPATERESP